MVDTETAQKSFDVFPHVDLLPSEADGLVVPLQNKDIFTQLHHVSHEASTLLSIAHLVIKATSYAQMYDKRQADALLVGCEIYEVISGALRPMADTRVSLQGLSIDVNELFAESDEAQTLIEHATHATTELRSNNPLLNEVVTEVAERRLATYGGSIVEYAVAGAGLLRGLQIRTDKKAA